MASERTNELYKVFLDRGYPKEFCAEIVYKNMNTDYTATRMLGYLYRVSNPRIEVWWMRCLQIMTVLMAVRVLKK